MSITGLSSKRFTQKKYVQIYTVQDISNILTPPPLHPHIHSKAPYKSDQQQQYLSLKQQA